jgi:pimeloyl-ACP methyl ester carboxylesterase
VPRFSSSDATTIVYDDDGTGPPVVLLHGFAGDRRSNWIRPGVVSRLAAEHRVIALDLRGHGESSRPTDPAAYADRAMARDVVELVAGLDLGSFDLVGYSLGAIVAASVARMSDGIARLVLAGMGDRLLDPEWKRPRLLAAALRGDREAARLEPLAGLIDQHVPLTPAERAALAGVRTVTWR